MCNSSSTYISSNGSNKKINISEQDWSKFNCKEFILDYFAVDWCYILKLENNDINTSSQNFFDCISKIRGKYSPLKKLGKYKHWINTALKKSISTKNKLFRNFIDRQDLTQKNEIHIKYKSYRNILSTLMKSSKQNYFTKSFSK